MSRALWTTIGLLPLAMCGALFLTEWRLLGGQHPIVGYGIFVLGAIVSVIGAWLLPQNFWLSLATALLMLLDTGSISWFVVMAWSDPSFWGKKNA